MKLWLFACLLACFVGAWVPVVHGQGAFEDCCLGYQPRIKWTILRHALRYSWQDVNGSCNLRAVIFYFRHKVLCGNPEDRNVKRAMKNLVGRNKLVYSPHLTNTSGTQTEKKKSSHAKSKVENPSSISVRNATRGRFRWLLMP
ncbi:C-C motif chemokine 25 [Acomys russatus]|uniref:C-C motif chemokine 25 n=1 Tax=Acomys russatus TaxID=60746 RepID=UPI0021E20A44|nr:C-C motif chemokine 25 [Acomys russatus]